jgi:hypothetical protein
VATDTHADFSNASRTALRHRYIVIQPWRTAYARSLKQANPGLRVLAHQNLSGAARAVNGQSSTGVTFGQAERHPRWFLRNRKGRRFTFDDYNWLWAMDVGSASYQRRWARNVAAKLGQGPWDGVLVDDVNATMRPHYPPRRSRKYPTDGAWQGATLSGLREISGRLRTEGLDVVANFGGWMGYPDVVDSWLPLVDGAMEEHWAKLGNSRGSGYLTGPGWRRQLRSAGAAQSAGTDYIAITHSSNHDADAALYGWASLLLVAQGGASFGLHSDYSSENWFAFYDYAIGTPSGAETTDANRVHRRVFSNGLVLVNPTNSAQHVQFGGLYHGSGIVLGSEATMPAHTGLVLLPGHL